MAVFYQEKKKRTVLKPFEITAEDLDLQGRGVAKAMGRTWFIPGVLPGEQAKVMPEGSRDLTGTARVIKLLKASDKRQLPDCAVSASCGGCPLIHLPQQLAMDAKVKAVRRLFYKNCALNLDEPDFVEMGAATHYRRACRLSVRLNHGKVELGFRERSSHELTAVSACAALSSRLNLLLPEVTAQINALEGKRKVGHVELVDSDGIPGLLLRLTSPLTPADESKLCAFGQARQVLVSLVEAQPHPLTDAEVLSERVLTDNAGEFFLQGADGGKPYRLWFKPSAFVQVNKEINELLQSRVVQQIQQLPAGEQRFLDLFCGLGNFAFALAAQDAGAQVTGVEVVPGMVAEARDNAARNGFANLEFVQADLEESFEAQLWAKRQYTAVVLDPGRQGAKRAVQFLAELKSPLIVMISCNPLAAARDSATLLRSGYRLKAWGALDMFPRTSHLELMLTFARQE